MSRPPLDTSAMIVDSLGGWRGALDSALPSAAFLIAYLVTGRALTQSIWAAVAVGALLAMFRLIRHEPLSQVISGFFALGISAFIAARTGRAEDFYAPGLLWNVVIAAVLIGSIVIRRPLLGYVYGAYTGDLNGWRDRPGIRRAAGIATLIFAGVNIARVAVQAPLYFAALVEPLGIARLIMGYPLYIAGAYVAYRVLVRAHRLEPAPPPVSSPDPQAVDPT